MIKTIPVSVSHQGLHDVTRPIVQAVAQSNIDEGLCTLYIQHTSASLLIQENYADGQLLLGTWQGIFLWEHRYGSQNRKIIVHIA